GSGLRIPAKRRFRKWKIKREILEGEIVKEEEVVRLVHAHVRFVGMVMEKGYEEAYRKWSRVFDKYKNIQ
ncbi:hypothetical protein CW713_10050, partial [Methanophagales archaeon]